MSVGPFLNSVATSFFYEYIVYVNIFSVTAALLAAKKGGAEVKLLCLPTGRG